MQLAEHVLDATKGQREQSHRVYTAKAQGKAEWFRVTAQMDALQSEVVTQRTNCLTTLQSQGTQQIELLKQIGNTLNEMHLEQRELLGYLKDRN